MRLQVGDDVDGTSGDGEVRDIDFSLMSGVHEGAVGITNGDGGGGEFAVADGEILEKMRGATGVCDDTSSGGIRGGGRT